MNLKLPNDFSKLLTSPDYVEVKLSSYWRKNKKDICDWVGPNYKLRN